MQIEFDPDVMGHLAVLTVVHTLRGDVARVISFRRASQLETEAYHAWLANDVE